uniref:Ubiquitin-protein ligase E3A n=1 Tax=Scylla olivacea TaxID=85551 RepID=A0A0P4WDM4_SCYOL
MSSPQGSPDPAGAEEGASNETIGNEEEAGAQSEQGGSSWPQPQDTDMKRAAAQLIEKYYFQLTVGCGNAHCDNPNCASSGKVGTLTSNEAAGKALQLCAARARLCEVVGAKVRRASQSLTLEAGVASSVSGKGHSSASGNTATCSLVQDVNMASVSTPSSALPPLSPMVDGLNTATGLTEETLVHTIAECRSSNNYAKLRRLLWAVFSNEIALRHSFIQRSEPVEKKSELLVRNKSKDNGGAQSKEEIRAQEEDLDKDLDSAEDTACEGEAAACAEATPEGDTKDPCKDFATTPNSTALDISEVRRAYAALFECPEAEFSSTLTNAVVQLLSDSLGIQLRVYKDAFSAIPNNINIFIILLESPALNTTDFIEGVMPSLCRTIGQLPERDQAHLTRHLASWEAPRLHRLLESLHQLITIRLLTTEFIQDFTINDEEAITSATQVMKLLFYASILGGKLDTPLLRDLPAEDPSLEPSTHEDPFSSVGKDWAARPPPKDSLGSLLGIHVLDARTPLVPLSEFYDDFLSDQLEMDRDFALYKAGSSDKFSFLYYPFILTPATKALGLYYDNRIRMYSERRMSIYQQLIEGMAANPYLKLRVRRDHIIDDALVELEMVALDNPGDLKKQMVVEFEGEQGIDEGGLSKEFFQLIVEQIFNPDYAMFCFNNESRTFWFNPNCFENDAQFTLVGIVLGLAIYNNVILDVHFPPVMYKKLCSKPGSFHDLRDWNTTLYRSLVELLEYEGDDLEEVFMQTFRVGYQDVFGTSLTHDLKTDGDTILVSQASKHEFVELYADFLLNKMVERQFRAFRRGFNMVTDDSPLVNLFRPEELELLICGSQHYDFMELMKSTEYDGGYTSETPIVQAFWELVHDMTTEDKKRLLQFTTGSARVPVGGLARLKLIIARHGPDCDRLPTAHTCFNVLLLPEYSSKEKLRDRLYKAIKYAQGFGML